MMTRPSTISVFPLAALATVCGISMSVAQEVPEYGSPQSYLQGSQEAITRGNFELGLKFIDKGIELYGERDLGFGNRFGLFYYYKGLCHLNLKQYDEAIKAFVDCYTKYPSDAAPNPNDMMRIALFRAGEAKALSGDAKGAITDINRFLEIRRRSGNSPDARQNLGVIYSYLAKAYFELEKPDYEKGTTALTVALTNRYKDSGCPDNNIIEATMALIETSIKHDQPEMALDFLRKRPSALNIGPDRIAPYCGQLVNCVSSIWKDGVAPAIERKDQKALNGYNQLILILSALVPDKQDVESTIKPMIATIDRLGQQAIRHDGIVYSKAVYSGALKGYQNMEVPIEAYSFRNAGDLQNNIGLTRAANVSYTILEDSYQMMPQRESNLFNLITTTWQLGDYDRGNKYITTFKAQFPESQNIGLINSLSIENLLKEKKFEECLAEATRLKEIYKDDKNNQLYILASYCEATSLYELKNYDKAIPLYVEFIKNYPEAGTYTQYSRFFLGSSYVSIRDWNNAIKATSTYIHNHPSKVDNPLLPNVYYERAFSYAQRNEEGDDQKCIADCQTIIDNFKTSQLYPLALIMQGNILSAETDPEKVDEATAKANENYQLAFELGKDGKNIPVASEALFYLMSNASDAGDKEKAQEYYELFWKECDQPDKPNNFTMRVGVFGMKLHDEGGPGFDAAAKKMRELIVREGRRDALNPEVEQAVGSYSSIYFDMMKKMDTPLTQDQAKEHFYNFPGVTNSEDDLGLRILLRTALIGVYQDMMRDAPKDDARMRAELAGAINVFFREIDRDFKPADIPTYTLLKLGTHLASSSQPLSSIPYFDEIISRNKDRVSDARYQKAIALGSSGDKAMIDQGIDLMQRELLAEGDSLNPDGTKLDEGQYYLTKFYMEKGDYDKALELCDKYLENRANRKYRLNVLYTKAECFDRKGDKENALIAYMNVADSFKGRIMWSAPATVRLMELFWDRNNPKPGDDPLKSSDRHLAWKTGDSYLRVTRGALDKMTVAERTEWEKVEELTKRYYGDTAVAAEDKAINERRAAMEAARGRK